MTKLVITLGAALALALVAAPVAAQSAPPAADGRPPAADNKPAPDKKPPAADAKPAPTIAGKWAMTLDLQSADNSSTLDLKLDGKKVTGAVVSQTGQYQLAGDYADGKLTFSMDYQGRYTVNFVGSLKEDGTLSGTMDYGQGPVNWKAERVKDR